jgi:hypothetical protein
VKVGQSRFLLQLSWLTTISREQIVRNADKDLSAISGGKNGLFPHSVPQKPGYSHFSPKVFRAVPENILNGPNEGSSDDKHFLGVLKWLPRSTQTSTH